MVGDYCYEVANPPTGFIPSSYEPPDLTILLIVLAIMVLELLLVGWLLRPWKRENFRRRAIFLASLNFVWGGLSASIGSNPPYPILWHCGWLFLLEIVLLVDIFIAVVRWLLRSVYRAIRRLPWHRIWWR